MSQTSELIAPETDLAETEAERSVEAQIIEAIADLQQYRDRLIAETTETAKKAKLMKSVMMEQLEPELAKIDAGLQFLREKQAAL
jgi:hypothetical protein